jgi:hypothetical protein
LRWDDTFICLHCRNNKTWSLPDGRRSCSASGLPAHVPLPNVHRIASLLKRRILGTHQGAIERDHLAAYLDEFTFRFNRRSSKARGLLFYRLLEQAF